LRAFSSVANGAWWCWRLSRRVPAADYHQPLQRALEAEFAHLPPSSRVLRFAQDKTASARAAISSVILSMGLGEGVEGQGAMSGGRPSLAEKWEPAGQRACSLIGFSVRHMVISKVRGKFNDFSGTIRFDSRDITKSSVDVSIKVASIDTGNEKRDGHLKGSDFFAAEKYPEITFRSKKIEKGTDGRYLVIGDLTIRGVTREVVIPFSPVARITDPWGKKRLGTEGELTINRQDYGVSWNKALEAGQLMVSNEVKIELSVEAVEQ